MRLEPSSRSEPPRLSPLHPSHARCSRPGPSLLLWMPPSSPAHPRARGPLAAAPSPWGGHPWEDSAGWIRAQGSRWLSAGQAGSEGTAGSGCVRRPRRKSLFRVIITQGLAVLDRRGSWGTGHPPRHTLGGPWVEIKLSPWPRDGLPMPGAHARRRGGTEDGLWPHAGHQHVSSPRSRGCVTPGSHSAPPSTEERGWSRSQKPSRAAAHRHPPRLGGTRGGQEVPPADLQLQRFRDGGRRLPTPQHLHVPTLRVPAPVGAQGSPAPPAQAPSMPHPLLSPTQGAPTALASPGARGTALRGCSPSTLQLSLAGAKRVPTHGGGGSGGCAGSSWAQDGAGGRAAAGEHGSAPGPGAGWAKGLGALQGSLASAPRPGGPSSTHPGGGGGSLAATRARHKLLPNPCWDAGALVLP